ncbi:MAG: hypothetical protein M3387_04580 [Actinomycetota bacterium]|nr:hypothetical protein [Actinomycetota bacterium]
MRMMLKARLDTAAATEAIQSGRLPQIMNSTLDKLQPEAAYFGPEDGKRTAFIVFDMTDSSQLPALTEQLFAALNAHVEIFPVMNRQDLEQGLSQLGGGQ